MLSGLSSFGTGFLLSATLIIAIGAQNAFVLRQGLRREHVALVVVFCAVSDALLMMLGVITMGRIVEGLRTWSWLIAGSGALFLAAYGVAALRRSCEAQTGLLASEDSAASRATVLAQVATFTFLNPHVYLDTVWLFGSVGAQQPPTMRAWFVSGGAAASLAWFYGLGVGARALAPFFSRPAAWRALDVAIGATMLGLSLVLVNQALMTL